MSVVHLRPYLYCLVPVRLSPPTRTTNPEIDTAHVGIPQMDPAGIAAPLGQQLVRAIEGPSELEWAAVDSNHLPPRYQHGALPVELAAHGLGKDRARSETGEPELYHARNPPSEAVPCR